MVDLFTRETILAHLSTRTQDNVAKTILRNIVFQRSVPRSLRTDNAPELSSLTGAVSVICEYLKIDQIRTGGHNPRGNCICERVNQSIGSMIRKLSDQEYKQLKNIALPAFSLPLTLRSILQSAAHPLRQDTDWQRLRSRKHVSKPHDMQLLQKGEEMETHWKT